MKIYAKMLQKLLLILLVLRISQAQLCPDPATLSPFYELGSGLCEDECGPSLEMGDSCSGGLKCCYDMCSYKCVVPIDNTYDRSFPKFGPESGNTSITIKGKFLQELELVCAELTLKSKPDDGETGARNITTDIAKSMTIGNSNETHIKLYTEALEEQEDYVGKQFDIHLTFNTSNAENFTYNTGFVFMYKNDPIITDFYPKSVFSSGGIALTVIGDNLDSVSQPRMKITLERRSYSNGTDLYRIVDTRTAYSPKTSVYNSTAILALTPKFDTSSRHKRQTLPNEIKLTNPMHHDITHYFIGFDLDGVERFQNLSQALGPEKGPLVVHYILPHIEQFTEERIFDPKTESFITIKGDNLTLGATISDYKVFLAKEPCDVLDLSINAIVIKPPNDEPELLDGKRQMKVTIGNLIINVGRVSYVKGITTLILIIGVAAATVLLIIIIAITVACHRCHTQVYKVNNIELTNQVK